MVLPDQFGTAVASQGAEGLIHPEKRAAGVRDGDAIGGGLQGGGLQTDLLLGAS